MTKSNINKIYKGIEDAKQKEGQDEQKKLY